MHHYKVHTWNSSYCLILLMTIPLSLQVGWKESMKNVETFVMDSILALGLGHYFLILFLHQAYRFVVAQTTDKWSWRTERILRGTSCALLGVEEEVSPRSEFFAVAYFLRYPRAISFLKLRRSWEGSEGNLCFLYKIQKLCIIMSGTQK